MESELSQWHFPPAELFPDQDLIAVGGDLSTHTILDAYRRGLFPMPVANNLIGWFSPVNRGILPLEDLRVTRSMSQSRKRYEVSFNRAFNDVIAACANPSRENGWISPEIIDAYTRLHEEGWAISVETWKDDNLVGGLYGVHINGFFAGESMFHLDRDASKVALVEFVERFKSAGGTLLDVQWLTPHLESLGAIEIPRDNYLSMLAKALDSDARDLTF